MKVKRVLALSMALAMVGVWTPAITSDAAELTQATNAASVKYGKLSKNEQALLAGMFDYEYYKATNPDVVAALGDDRAKLFEHFVKCGIFEGRSLNATFNVSAYASAYADVAAAFGDDIIKYYQHYATFGQKENRTITTLAAAAEAGITVHPIDNPEIALTPAVIKVAEAKGITDTKQAIAAASSSTGAGSSSNGGSAAPATKPSVPSYPAQLQVHDMVVTTSDSAYTVNIQCQLAGNVPEPTGIWKYEWSSSNEDVATIASSMSDANNAAVITVKGVAGESTISVKYICGDYTLTGTCKLTVKDEADIEKTIKFKIQNTNVISGFISNLNNQELLEVVPANADIVWSSSDTTNAPIDQNGEVIWGSAGTYTITAALGSDADAPKANITVTVYEVNVTVTLDEETADVEQGGTKQLTANEVVNPDWFNDLLSWESSDESVATVNENGLVTVAQDATVGATATIKVKSTRDASKYDECIITVIAASNDEPDEPQTVSVESVSFSEGATKTATVGDSTFTLTPVFTPADATVKTGTWESSNTEVATVADGEVTIVGEGAANITFTTTDGSKVATCALTVNPAQQNSEPDPDPEP